jgi:hypothetical protein
MNRRIISLALMAGLAALALTAADTYSLKRVANVGDVLRYRTDVELTVQGRSATISTLQIERVLKSGADGYEIEERATDQRYRSDGQDVRVPGEDRSVAAYDTRGQLLELRETALEPDSYRRANMVRFIAPKDPVAIGDGWTHEFPSDSKRGVVSAQISYKVDAREMIGSYEAVKLSFEFKELEGSRPITNSGTMWVSIRDGSVVRLTSNFANLPLGDPPVPVNGRVSMRRE